MIFLKHRRPRYVYDRVRWGLHQRRHPDEPWIVPAAASLLATLLRPADAGLELGAGRSTYWFAARLRHLTSFEHVPAWHATVRDQLAARGIANVDCELRAAPGDVPAERSPYVRGIDRFADQSLGFALVDGGHREHCANALPSKIEAGGVLVLDNANWYIDHPSRSPASRSGQGHLTDGWARFVRRVAGWRHVWTSNGISDTAIWIRPAGWVDPSPEPMPPP